MYHELTNEEIQEFINKYTYKDADYVKNIYHISSIEYDGIIEYMINYIYILRVYK